MLIHSISVYSWCVCLIKDLEKYMRNFIWSRELISRKMVIIAWHKVCQPLMKYGWMLDLLFKLMKLQTLSFVGTSCKLTLLIISPPNSGFLERKSLLCIMSIPLFRVTLSCLLLKPTRYESKTDVDWWHETLNWWFWSVVRWCGWTFEVSTLMFKSIIESKISIVKSKKVYLWSNVCWLKTLDPFYWAYA